MRKKRHAHKKNPTKKQTQNTKQQYFREHTHMGNIKSNNTAKNRIKSKILTF